MPHIIFEEEATRGIARCIRFLYKHSPTVAHRAKLKIDAEFKRIQKNPFSGHYWSENKKYRECNVRFGLSAAYMILYTFNESKDEIRVVSFRHSRELAYKLPEDF